MQRLAPLIAAVLMVLAGTAGAQADDDTPSLDEIPHITIIGTAQIEAKPDLATISLGVTTEQPTAKAAAAETATKAQAVIDAAKAAGVPAIDIATRNATLTQTFDLVKNERGQVVSRKPRGYSATNTVEIKVRDLDKAGTIAEGLIDQGANRFDGVRFSVQHPDPILVELSGAAVKDARNHAEAAADAAGVRLGRVLLIQRQGASLFYPQAGALPRAAAAAPAAMPLAAGTTSFSTSIAVTWALDQR